MNKARVMHSSRSLRAETISHSPGFSPICDTTLVFSSLIYVILQPLHMSCDKQRRTYMIASPC